MYKQASECLNLKQFYNGVRNMTFDATLKGALSGLRHFLATESSLKMLKNAF